MKTKLKALLLIVVISSLSNQLFAQAFEKGNWNIDTDLGIGIYGTKSTTTSKFGPFSQTKSEVDGTASSIFRLGVEYGLTNRIGLGVKFGYNNYFIAEEDKDTLNSVRGIDFLINVNFHLLKANRNDLFISLGLGVSNAKWDYNTLPGIFLSSASGKGTYFTFGITDRIFFTDNIGILLNLSYAGYKYDVTYDLTEESKAALSGFGVFGGYSIESELMLRGVYFGTGLAVKF